MAEWRQFLREVQHGCFDPLYVDGASGFTEDDDCVNHLFESMQNSLLDQTFHDGISSVANSAKSADFDALPGTKQADVGSTGVGTADDEFPVRLSAFRCSICQQNCSLSFAYVTDAMDGRDGVSCG